jgi:hypothetical protein
MWDLEPRMTVLARAGSNLPDPDSTHKIISKTPPKNRRPCAKHVLDVWPTAVKRSTELESSDLNLQTFTEYGILQLHLLPFTASL